MIDEVLSCDKKRMLCDDDDCNICFNKSFQSIPYHTNLTDKSINARKLSKFSNKHLHFSCDKCNHGFTKMVQKVSDGQKCPYCAIPSKILCNNKDCIVCFDKSFAVHDKSQYWDFNKNDMVPREIFKNSANKYFFICNECEHNFDIAPVQINSQGHFCPYCVNQRLCGVKECKTCIDKSFAKNSFSKYWSDKNEIMPYQIFNKTHKKYKFDCRECNHEFEIAISHIRENKLNCVFCASNTLCNNNSCDTCFNKSFASHEKSKFWDYIKNDKVPREIFKNANSKYFFLCDKCEHSFDILPQTINGQDQFCPYCVNQKLCDDTDCKICFEKSFAKNLFSQYWSLKNNEKPRDIFNRTHKKYLFKCKDCNHELEIGISHIREDTLNCVYCGSKILCDNKDCEPCFNKSFASHEKSKYWSIQNKVLPRTVFKSTHDKYIFNCLACKKDFSIILSSITNGDSWCAKCVNKTEKKLCDWLCEKNGEENIKTQYLIKENDKKYFYDFHILKFNLIIELDGLQHFKQVSKWKTPEFNLVNDMNKINLAIKNKKSIIHILQEDVLYNRNNWENKLITCIKQYEKPSCIFIDNNEIYKTHIQNVNNKINIFVL